MTRGHMTRGHMTRSHMTRSRTTQWVYAKQSELKYYKKCILATQLLLKVF